MYEKIDAKSIENSTKEGKIIYISLKGSVLEGDFKFTILTELVTCTETTETSIIYQCTEIQN